jgi:anti-sigma B factor antagonist
VSHLPTPFRCETSTQGDTVVVEVTGEVDIATAGQVGEALTAARAAGPQRVLLNLSAVTFLDSSGLRVVLSADAEARTNGIAFEILRGGPTIQRVFEVAGLTDHLRFADAA